MQNPQSNPQNTQQKPTDPAKPGDKDYTKPGFDQNAKPSQPKEDEEWKSDKDGQKSGQNQGGKQGNA